MIVNRFGEHREMLKSRKEFRKHLQDMSLGIYFTILQGYEYIEAHFTIADSIYGCGNSSPARFVMLMVSDAIKVYTQSVK
jgi:hypothetical protein